MSSGNRQAVPRRQRVKNCVSASPIREPLTHDVVTSVPPQDREQTEDEMNEVRHHFEVLAGSKLSLLLHVTSQHSVLDVLYGDQGRPMPSWTFQTTPEVGVSDQQHTGRCWIFATLAVLGHVFRSQYGINNQRATFSEGYLGFWDLYEKSRLFLQVAYDTRCVPLEDPSLCDLLKNGISDGGDYIFCMNLLDRYGIVPTEYYPNSSYGSMSTEALVTLVNQMLRDNAITLRTTGDKTMIKSMLTNIFSLLCFGLGVPPMPMKKLNWQIDQCETIAHYAADVVPPAATDDGGAAAALGELIAEAEQSKPAQVGAPQAKPPAASPPMAPSRPAAPGWSTTPARPPQPGQRPTFPVIVPPPPPTPPPPAPAPPPLTPNTPAETAAIADLVSALQAPASPTQSVTSNVTAAPFEEEEEVSSSPAVVVTEVSSSTTLVGETNAPGELELQAALPPKRIVDIPTRESAVSAVCIDASKCARQPGTMTRLMRRLRPSPGNCAPDVPPEGSGAFFSEAMGDEGGCLRGRKPACDSGNLCRLSHTITESSPSPRHRREPRIVTPPSSGVQSDQPREEDALMFDYTPRDFYLKFFTGVRYVPLVCDARFPSGTRIISNDANMYGGLPSLYLNVTIDDIESYTIASLKRNIPVWFACDVKKQLSPEGGRMCSDTTDRLASILPEPHLRGTKLQEISHFNAIANHALLISAVSMKPGTHEPDAWRIVNSWGDVGRNSGVFVACGDWFRQHVYSINAVYDTLSKQHRADIDLKLSRPTVRLGPFDPSVI